MIKIETIYSNIHFFYADMVYIVYSLKKTKNTFTTTIFQKFSILTVDGISVKPQQSFAIGYYSWNDCLPKGEL